MVRYFAALSGRINEEVAQMQEQVDTDLALAE